jgi:hypothetical protein
MCRLLQADTHDVSGHLYQHFIDHPQEIDCNDPFAVPQTQDVRGVSRPLDGNADGSAPCEIGVVRRDELLANGFESARRQIRRGQGVRRPRRGQMAAPWLERLPGLYLLARHEGPDQ